MQKKLLLSLVCTVPAALPALADVALTVPDVNNWNTTGIQGVGVKVEGTKVTCEVGQGTVCQTVKGLPAGKYKISFGSLINATWSVDGATVTVNKDNKAEGTFELTKVGDITININAADPTTGYGFTDGALTFVYNFAQKAGEFQTALDKAEKIVTLADPQAAKALKDEQKKVQDQLAAINKIIGTLNQADKNTSEAISVADLIKVYSASKVDSFEALFAKLTADIEAYTKAVAAWNVKAKADNERYNIVTTNANNLKSLQGSIESLLNGTDGVNPLIAAINAEGVDKAVKDANLKGAQDVKAKIESFKAEVEAAFKGATAIVDTKGLNETKDALTEELAATWAKFNNDMTAIKIFEDVQAVYTELKPNNDYLAATADITGITDAKEYTGTDVYAGLKTQWLNKIQEAYTPIKEPATFEEVKAVWGVEGYRTEIKKAVEAMQQVVTDAQAYAKAQNDLYVAGYNLYATKTTGWDAQIADYKTRVCNELPAELTAAYQALIEKAEKAVAAFKAVLDKNYVNQAEGGLTGAGYDEAVVEVNKALADVDKFLNGDGNTGYGAVSALIADLAKVQKDNTAQLKKLELPADKFDASYDAIQAAIDAIVKGMNEAKDHKADAAKVENARKAIDELTSASTTFFKAFGVAHTNLVNARKNLDTFKKLIDSKYCAENGGNYAADKVDEYKLLNAKLNGGKIGKDSYVGYEKEYTDAAKAVGQESYELGTKLGTEIDGFAKSITDAQKAWLVAATQANLDFAKKRSADLEAFMNAHTTLKTSVKFAEINTALGKITVPAAGADAAKFTEADKAIKKQMDVMDGLNKSVANYETVEKVLGEIVKAQADAEKANNETTVGATAKKYYADLIAATADTKAIVKALETAFNGKDGVTDAVKKAQLDAANAKLNTLKDLPKIIAANQTAYSNQIAKSGDVRTAIQAIVDELGKAEYQGVVKPWLDQLNELLDVRLIANDVKVGENYGKGQSAVVNTEVMAEYDAILKAAQDVQVAYNDGYAAKIIEANNALNGDMSNWGHNDKLLNDEYLNAVKLYTFYKYNLTEAAGYAEEMAKANLVANYAAVYDFLPRIQKLNSDIQALITKANAAKQYLPESEKYQAEYEDLVEAQKNELTALKGMYDNLKADGDLAATNYYNAKTAEYATLVSDVTSELTAAGFTADEAKAALKNVTDILANADELFKGSKLTKGETMNTIAENYFSKIGTKKAIVDAAAIGKWNASYDLAVNGKPGKPATDKEPAVPAVPSVNELRSTIADNGGTKAQLDAFDAIVKKMAELNKKATEDKELIKNLQTDLTKLDGFRQDLEDMAQEVSDNAKYKDLWNKYMGEYAEVEELVNILNEYIAEFNLDAPVSVYPDPEDLLANLKNMIGNKPNAGVADKNFATDVETQKGLIIEAVDGKMVQTNFAAIATLSTWIDNAKAAYNTAIANGKKPADIQAEYDTIQNLVAELANLNNDLNGDQGFKGDFPEIVNGYLNTAIETYKKLIPDTAAAELDAVKAALEAEKDGIAKEIDKANKALETELAADIEYAKDSFKLIVCKRLGLNYWNLTDEETVKVDAEVKALLETLLGNFHSEMDAKYGELNAALDAIQADWEAEGDLLLVNNYEYYDRLDEEVQDKIAGVNGEAYDVFDKILKVQINKEVAANLNSEWEELSKLFTEVKTNVENWGLIPAFGREIGELEATLADLQKAIAKQADNTALNMYSTLEDVFNAVYDGTLYREYVYTKQGQPTEDDINSNITEYTVRVYIDQRIENVGAMAAAMQTEYLRDESQKAYQEAHKTLAGESGKYYLNGAALKEAYNDLYQTWYNTTWGYNERISENESIWHPGCNNYLYYDENDILVAENAWYGDIKLYLGWIDSFNSIIESSKALIESAQGQEYTPGDVVNRDGKVTSQDVMKIVDWVGNGVTYNELAASEETLWQAVAADIDGNKSINIGDINADIYLALGRSNIPGGKYEGNLFKKPAATVQSNVNCTLAYLGNVDGNDRYAVVLNNETEFIGGQFDIKLPIGMTLVNVVAAERTEAHEVVTFEHDAYESRVLIFSMNNDAIKGNNGALVYIDVQGHGSFSLDEIIFSDSKCNLYGVGNPGTSGIIDAVIDGAGAVKDAIYDAAGRMYDRVQRGVNIIRHSDGTVTKELRK